MEDPAQIVGEEGLIDTVNGGLTVTVRETVFEQPSEFVPVTEYAVVTVGLTVILAVVAPVFQW